MPAPAAAADPPRLRLEWLRAQLRASEAWFIALAVAVGAIAGFLAVLLGRLSLALQRALYGFTEADPMILRVRLPPSALIWLPVGGAALGLAAWAMARWRPRAPLDVVEANALFGGRLALRDSFVVCVQTFISNGFGASVGLEAAYAQAGGGSASAIGRRLNLRRQDLRTLVGAGAGAAIAAAFGAPLTGAFYAFEVVIGTYTASTVAPVAAAALAGAAAARLAGSAPYALHVAAMNPPEAVQFLLYGLLGAVCAGAGVAIMRLVAWTERMALRLPIAPWQRMTVGGALLMGLASVTPLTLGSGHAALEFGPSTELTLAALCGLFLLKTAASAVSLGFGFRGGLFFASLLLGSLVGQIFAGALAWAGASVSLEPAAAGMVGMAALAVAVVGAPLTMSFLVLETTSDFGVAAAALAAALVASSIVRERFGYSFSTWRLHLRGQTIRSARDVGWVRNLTAGRMMRAQPAAIEAAATVAEFRRRFPLGSATRVVALDEARRYAGVIETARAYAAEIDVGSPVADLAQGADAAVAPGADIEEVMRIFDATQLEEVAVVDENRQVLGLLSESLVARRYAKELEQIQQGLFGEGSAQPPAPASLRTWATRWRSRRRPPTESPKP